MNKKWRSPIIPGFWELLEKGRKESRKTLDEIARELGIHFTTISKAKKKRSLLTGFSLERLAEVFGIRPEELGAIVPEEHLRFFVPRAKISLEIEREDADILPLLKVLVMNNKKLPYSVFISKLNSLFHYSKMLSQNRLLSVDELKGVISSEKNKAADGPH